MKTYILFALLLTITACNPTQAVRLDKLNIGMTKDDVTKVLEQPPYNVVGSKKLKDGTVEVWEYRRYSVLNNQMAPPQETYWLYFLNGKLDRWGRPGDWSKEADQIYEVRVNDKSLR